jgi:nucleotide-binding universal stress UspA family protein
MGGGQGLRGPIVLVVLQGETLDTALVEFACRLARERAATLWALYIIEVPLTRSLADWHGPAEERARQVLAEAVALAARLGCTLRTSVLPARSIGSAIVDEASERAADLVIVGLPQQPAARQSIWRAVEGAPCAVLLWQPQRTA